MVFFCEQSLSWRKNLGYLSIRRHYLTCITGGRNIKLLKPCVVYWIYVQLLIFSTRGQIALCAKRCAFPGLAVLYFNVLKSHIIHKL